MPCRVADLAVEAAFEAAVAKYPDKRICNRERVITTGSRGRLIFALVRSSDRGRRACICSVMEVDDGLAAAIGCGG